MAFDPRLFARWIFQSVHQTEPASFAATGSPKKAAQTLEASIHRRRFTFRDKVVGSVSTTRVVLPLSPFQFSFAPTFRGQFVTRCGRTHLEGRFQLNVAAQVIVTIWFGFGAIFCLVAMGFTLMALVTSQVAPWRALLGGAVSLAAALGLMALGAWWVRLSCRMYSWRYHVEFITAHIRQVLGKRVS